MIAQAIVSGRYTGKWQDMGMADDTGVEQVVVSAGSRTVRKILMVLCMREEKAVLQFLPLKISGQFW